MFVRLRSELSLKQLYLYATIEAGYLKKKKQDWIIDEWVHPNTFFERIGKRGYSLKNDVIEKGDIISWVNEDGVIKHAAYHLDNNLFFNKNGQTFFNPWKITDLNKLNEEWCQYKMMVYRKR